MMFEERYRKLYQDITPSEDLNHETVDLMIEARNHRAKPLPPPKSKLPMILWISAGSTVAAALIVTVAVLAWVNRGARIDESLGVFDPNAITEQETVTNENTDEDHATDSSAKQEDEVETETLLPEIAALPSERYESFEAYFKALDDKKTLGYGEQYYLAKEQIVVPAGLPETAVLVEILQYEDGQYAYSYRLETEDGTYLLTVQSRINLADTAEAMDAQVALLAEEAEPTFISEGNARTYQFGALDAITVIVTREAEEPAEETTETEEEPAESEDEAESETTEEPVAAETVDGEAVEGESVEGNDSDASVSSTVQPTPLTKKEVDALLKDFTLSRYNRGSKVKNRVF